MNTLVIIVIIFILLKSICDFFQIRLDIKSHYKRTYKLQMLLKLKINSQAENLLKRFGTKISFGICFVGVFGFLASTYKYFFMGLTLISFLLFPIVEFIVNGYDMLTSTTYFFKRAVPMWFTFFFVILSLIINISIKKQINGYLLYFASVLIMCFIWFLLISLASLKVMKMVSKVLKSGVAILGAIWASIYAFISVQTPSFIASFSNVSVEEVLEELSRIPQNNSKLLNVDYNVLEMLKVTIPIVVLPFLLIVFVTDITYDTKSYWVKYHNNNLDIDSETDNVENN